MLTNPYQELGVPKDADAATVKRAYQRRARKAHPDKGGDTAAFQRVSAAYRLLADPAKRARYDQTGQVEDGPDNGTARLLSIIATLVLGAVNQLSENDVRYIDVMGEVRKRIDLDIKGVNQALKDTKKKIKHYEAAAKRVARKGGGENLVAMMLTSEAAKHAAVVQAHQNDLELLDRLKAFAADYEWMVDERPKQTVDNGFIIFRSGT